MAILLLSHIITIQVIEDMISQNICHNPQTSSQNSGKSAALFGFRILSLCTNGQRSQLFRQQTFLLIRTKSCWSVGFDMLWLFPQRFVDLCKRFQCPHTSNGYGTSPQMMWNIAVVPVDSDQRCILELTQDSFRSKSDGWNCFASSHFNNRQLGCFRQIFEPLVEAALLFLNDPTVHSPVTKHQHIGPCRFPVRAPWQRTAFEAPQQVDAAGFSHAFGADGLTIFRRQGRTVLLHDGLDFLPSNQCTNLHRRHQMHQIRKVSGQNSSNCDGMVDGKSIPRRNMQKRHSKLRQLWSFRYPHRFYSDHVASPIRIHVALRLIPRLQIPFWDLYAGHIFRISGPNVVIVFHALHSGESLNSLMQLVTCGFQRTTSKLLPIKIDIGQVILIPMDPQSIDRVQICSALNHPLWGIDEFQHM